MTPEEIRDALGDVAVSDAYGLATADVPAERWTDALTAARDVLGLTYFDWLSAVDETDEGFSVVVHVCAAPGPRLLLRTRVPRDAAHLPTATGVYAGAVWHERETAEMFGLVFDDHPHPEPLLLPDGFEGHPLRKDFVLASRVAKAWPGAKEPGESDTHEGTTRAPGRRRILPPGVPDPNEWGPNAGRTTAEETPPRPEPRAGRAGRTPGDRPARPDRPRRNRSASQGSASQQPPPSEGPEGPEGSGGSGGSGGSAERAPESGPKQATEPAGQPPATGTSDEPRPRKQAPPADTPPQEDA
ncbi:NADH-quinone oxidoreductase subunit C [Yinghuangia sp. YIM S09857]|uniref:NADH-quinone oxidoreductase subunit C n=1 Tax=Yinghuangia sp. YIM S09857 TaxID=3436929 RepID=UPI003F534E33